MLITIQIQIQDSLYKIQVFFTYTNLYVQIQDMCRNTNTKQYKFKTNFVQIQDSLLAAVFYVFYSL